VFGRLRIRGKLAVVVAIPMVAMALLTTPGVAAALNSAQRAEEIRDTMLVANRVTSLISELRQERLMSLGYLFSLVDRAELTAQSARATDRLVDIAYDVRDGTLPAEALSEPVAAALAEAEGLDRVREQVLRRLAGPAQVVDRFGSVINLLVDSLRLVDGIDLATDAARQVAALDASMRISEQGSQATDLLFLIVATGDEQLVVRYTTMLQGLGNHFERFAQYATAEQLAQLTLIAAAFEARDETGTGQILTGDPRQVAAEHSADAVFQAMLSLSRLGRLLETKVITDVVLDVEALSQAQRRTAYLVVLGAILVMVVVMVMTATLARAVVRPLVRLTDSARQVAQVADAELSRIADDDSEAPTPARIDPVSVTGSDEIGDLATAFNVVQQTAVRLVERQAASRRNVALMFGYLGRRTHNLVGRQLLTIDQLERAEQDPSRLAELYRLDHISSRLRRNAASLVALSGSTGADEHVAPLPLADVVRLALGEIEEYNRVEVAVPPDIVIAPAVIGDLVLVLAELMENAATFSPPHTRVLVTAVAGNGGVEVSIADHGLGMSPERLAEENARMTRRERLDLAPTELLGLVVVGRLARRHGLQVALSPTAGGGVTATVRLGPRLLSVREADPPAPTLVKTASAAPPADDRPRPASPATAVPSPGSGLVNLEALTKATRALEAGRRWNAFAIPQAAPAATPAPAEQRSGLRRRTPGATLESIASAAPPRGPGPLPVANPDEARRLVELLQEGVTRAMTEIESSGITEEERDD
jgi:signal transduction histidine kinase